MEAASSLQYGKIREVDLEILGEDLSSLKLQTKGIGMGGIQTHVLWYVNLILYQCSYNKSHWSIMVELTV